MPTKKLKKAKQSVKRKSKSSPNEVTLNIECLLIIFSYLTISERIKVERVCKLWEEASRTGWLGFHTLNFKKSLWGFSSRSRVTITDKILRNILLRCGKNLRKIQFPQNELDANCLNISINQRGLRNMVQMCKNLKILDLGFQYIRSSVLSMLGNSSFNLEILRLNLNGNMTDDDFSKIFASNKKLKIIHLFNEHSCKICTCVKYLPKNSIEEIVICNCYGFGDSENIQELFSSFIYVMPMLQKFRKLSIHNITHKISTWSLNSCGEGITSLDLRGCHILHDTTMVNLPALTNLQELFFCANFGEADEFIVAVSKTCTKLVKLVLRDCHLVTDTGLSALAARLNLKHLELIGIENVYGMDLPKMHSLQYFRSTNCGNIKEDYYAQMLLSAAADSRKFYLTNCYCETLYGRKFPIFNGNILQAVEQIHQNRQNLLSITTKLKFQQYEPSMSKRVISITLDYQKSRC